MGKFRRFIFFAVAFFIISGLSRTIFEYRKNYAFYEEYKKEYEQEKKKNIELQTHYVKTKDSYEFEKIARNKLDLHLFYQAFGICKAPFRLSSFPA